MSRHPFDLLMELDTDLIRLDCAALQLARDVYPGLNVSGHLRTLDEMAARLAALRPGLAANLRYEAMRATLVDHYQLNGNHLDYYSPDNGYLNRVLETRRGIPITLAIVWIEVGRRLKWPVSGVGLPGRFLVRFDDPERLVLADPFHSGRSLSLADCRRIVQERFHSRVSFSLDHLKPVGTRAILLRLLKHLRNIYLANDDLPRVTNALRRLAAVEPHNGRHLQELAAVCCRLGDMRGACAHLELYLRRRPRGRESAIVRHNLRQLQAALIAMN